MMPVSFPGIPHGEACLQRMQFRTLKSFYRSFHRDGLYDKVAPHQWYTHLILRLDTTGVTSP
jgi:hypothetical protein